MKKPETGFYVCWRTDGNFGLSSLTAGSDELVARWVARGRDRQVSCEK